MYRVDLADNFSVHCGDAIEVLKTLPSESVHCCITSPPYYGLRDYGVQGQIGLEETPDQYIERLVEVFKEVRRVLRDDGTFWVNIGDSYSIRHVGRRDHGTGDPTSRLGPNKDGLPGGTKIQADGNKLVPGMKPKDLIGIPWMLAFALRKDGWYLRSEIIWHKPNPMPESVKDRPTKAHEQIFLLSKSEKYYYDFHAIQEDAISDGQQRRNKRSVWTIPTAPLKAAHFAVFPPRLIEPCILAGSSEKGACTICGAPMERVLDDPGNPEGILGYRGVPNSETRSGGFRDVRINSPSDTRLKPGHNATQFCKSKFVGWTQTCGCGEEQIRSCIVLDPFSGSGTTGVVAAKHGRSYIGIELNPEYIEITKKRYEKEIGTPAPTVASLDSVFE